MTARKDDATKPRLDLIPPEAMFAMGRAFAHGAEKYAARNWEQGLEWGRLFAALQRHLWAWQAGDAWDAETGLSHLDHAAACLAMLLASEAREIGEDDRGLK